MMAHNTEHPMISSVLDAVFAKARELSFDWFHLKIQTTRQIAWRLAHNQLSRENINKEQIILHFQGIVDQRQGSLSLPLFNLPKIITRLEKLREDIVLQAPDEELVIPQIPPHDRTIEWKRTGEGLFEQVCDDDFVAGVGVPFQRLRDWSIRLTGFIELAESRQISCYFTRDTQNTLQVTTQESAGTVSITLDLPEGDFFSRPRPGASATSKCSLMETTWTHITQTVLDSIAECLSHLAPDKKDEIIFEPWESNPVQKLQQTPHGGDSSSTKISIAKLGMVEPGPFTVVLHPHAVFELIQTMIMYNLFDRRKVDEGRTYLSRPDAVKTFPVGLVLERPFVLPSNHGEMPLAIDFPLNEQGQPCNALTLISGGHLRDMLVTPYWGQKTGLMATFGPWAAPPLHLNFVAPHGASREHAGHGMTLAQDLKQLIESTENGLFVSHFWYLRMVNEMEGTITGMTRDGLFKIHNGQITEPLMNMRWHANPFQVLSQITGMTKEKRLLGLSRHLGLSRSPLGLVPAVRVREFPFTSRSTF